MEKKSVPLLDMKDENIGEKMVKAWSEWGCFRMINHGISPELMAEMKVVARALTDLPMEVKLRNVHPHHLPFVYIPLNVGTRYFEGLSLYDASQIEALDRLCSQLDITPYQREVLNKYRIGMYELAQLVGRKLTEGLGIDGGELFKNWAFQIKMNKYSYGPESVGKTGGALHTDPGFLTLLQDDEIVDGLEFVDSTGQLVPLDPIAGTIVANPGDVAQVWSNGRLRALKHRVQCNQPMVRTSIAFFALAPADGKVEAPPQLVDSDHPRLYGPFDFKDYRNRRVATASGIGQALQYYLLSAVDTSGTITEKEKGRCQIVVFR